MVKIIVAIILDHITFSNLGINSFSTEKINVVNDFIETGILILLKKIVTCIEIYYPEQNNHLQKLKDKHQIHDSHSYLTNLLSKRKIFTKHTNDKFMIN